MRKLYELRDIEQHYNGKKVLEIEDLTIEENQIIGFFGPNGSGKSTLFSLLSFIDNPTLGEVRFNGMDIKKIDNKVRQDIIIVPQNPYLLKRSVFENIAYGLRIRNDVNLLEDRVNEALSIVGLDSSFANRKWSQLSGGESQRVALAARLILKPKVLILDEPTTGVDTNSAQLIKEAILIAKQKWNTSILISSHDHHWLSQICDKKIALFQGNLLENENMNLIFAPWKKDEKNNLIKYFADGQFLVIENSYSKKSDSIAMIDSDAFEICRTNCKKMIDKTTLIGTVTSIGQQQLIDFLLIEFTIGGTAFNCRVHRDVMQEQRFLPGDNIYVNINTSNVRWI